jgi:hypothetical protein
MLRCSMRATSCRVRGWVPAMALAEQTQLSALLAEKVSIAAPRIALGSANAARS